MANTKIQSEQIADDVALAGSPTTTTQSASDNSTKVATTAYVTTAVANLVDSAPSSLNTLNELAAAMNDNASFFSTVLPLSGGTMTGDLILGDNVKLEVGSASGGDLQIYHDTNHSYIEEAGTGALKLKGDDVRIENASGNNIIKAVSNSAELYENGSKKLETSSTGISVTGSVTADGMTVNGAFSFSTSVDGYINSPAALYLNFDSDNNSAGEALIIGSNRASGSGGTEHLRVDASGNLMVGTQDSAPAVSSSEVGVAISGASGYVAASRSNSASGFFNRLSDGDIIALNKDGALIGSVGATSGSMYIEGNPATGKVGLTFYGSSIEPRDTGAAATNAVDLGATGTRFKDLFLSNSVDISKTTSGNITGGTSNQGAVITLHHEAQWENGYTGGDFLGAINFSSGDASSGEGVRAAIKTSVDTYYNTNTMRFYVAQSNSTTLVERLELEDTLVFKGRTGTSPAVEMINFDNEDNDTGRESTLRFKGHRSGGELVTNAQISGHHSGNADDDKGMLIFWTNTGSGGLTEKARIIDDGGITFNGDTASANALDDYEEGTCTITIAASVTNPTISQGNTFTAYYTKVGNKVTVTGYTGTRTITNVGSGIAKFAGLPFNCLANAYAVVNLAHNTMFTSTHTGYIEPNTNTWYPIGSHTTSGVSYPSGGKVFMFTTTYLAN